MKDSIRHLQELVHELDSIQDPRAYLSVISRAKLDVKELENHFFWSSDHYGRVCLSRTPSYELVLTCWEPGQQSPIHDYEAHQVWTHPLRGKLSEEKFVVTEERLQRVSKMTLCDDDFSFFDGVVGIHRYTNSSRDRAVSLHLFVNPVDSWKVYDEDSAYARTTVPQYDRNYCMKFAHG